MVQTQLRRETANRAPRRSIAAKLALLVATAVVSATIAMGSLLLWSELSHYAATKSHALLGAARIFASATARATANRDQNGAYQALRAIASIPDLRYARVEYGRGQLLAVLGGSTQLDNDIRISDSKPQIRPLDLLSTQSIQADVPIIDGGVKVGRFILVADTSDLADQLWTSLQGVVTGALAGLIFGLLVALRLQRGLSRPLLELNEAVWRIRRNHDFTDRVKAASNDEVGLLIEGFNSMLAEIEERDSRLDVHRRTLEKEVSERTRDLRIAKDAAEGANAAKSDFLATMSHEIRTPMNGVMVMAELLAASDIPDRQRRYAEVISKSGQSLLAIINDILDFSKIESGKLSLERIALNPAELAEDVTSLFGERAREKGIDLVSYVAPATPRLITGDPVRINQVLSNLVNNALKFTEAGSVTLKIAPDRDDPSRLRVSVTDTGVGIRAHKLKDIFGAFTQADQSTTRRFGGTGLGLAISKRLVEAMEGELEAKSVYGRGSTFSFSIPIGQIEAAPRWPRIRSAQTAAVRVRGEATRDALARYLAEAGYDVIKEGDGPAPPADVVIADAEFFGVLPRADSRPAICIARLGEPAAHQLLHDGRADATLAWPLSRGEIEMLLRRIIAGRPLRDARERSATSAEHLPSYRGLNVLVADDTAINREVAIETLERLGAVPATAENGLEAVAAIEARTFDVVLMDVSMPELDGFEATRRIRALELRTGGPRTPIIGLTAHVVGGAADAWRDAGMDAVLYKPFTLKSLSDVLTRFVKPRDANSAEPPPKSDAQTPPPPVAAQAEAESKPVLNDDTLRELRAVDAKGSKGFLQRVIGLYFANAPKAVEDLSRAMQARDYAALGSAAHALKSMSLNIGAERVTAKAAEIERAAHEHAASLSNADVEALRALLGEALSALDDLRAETTKETGTAPGNEGAPSEMRAAS